MFGYLWLLWWGLLIIGVGVSFLGCQGRLVWSGWCLAYRGCWLVGRDVVSKNGCGVQVWGSKKRS